MLYDKALFSLVKTILPTIDLRFAMSITIVKQRI